MSIPVFEEVEPLSGCVCERCARQRLADSVARLTTGGPVASAGARAVVLAAVAGTTLVAGAGVSAALPAAPIAPAATGGARAVPPEPAPPSLTREQIMERARAWTEAKVPYSRSRRWNDGYRQDCSGYISMAWGLDGSQWTGNLPDYAERVDRDELLPGDILLFHNAADPEKGSHAVIFGGWENTAHTWYTAYEETKPAARARSTPLAYWTNSEHYVAYRYKYLVEEGDSDSDAFPGGASFSSGKDSDDVTRLGEMLVSRGAAAYYRTGPGPRWSEADLGATRAFQRAQGWKGEDADGFPGPATWRHLIRGDGNDVGAAPRSAPPADPHAPAYPGAERFRQGRSDDHILTLGRQLVARGFGRSYHGGPGSTWTEAHRRAVEAFQRAQGWSGRDADGHPGPETWRRLFT